MAQNPADTKAGKEVTNLFESILQTNPTSAQLTRLVREMRSGMSVAALRKDLTAEARAHQGARAQPSMNAVVINGDPSAGAMTSTRSAATGRINLGSMRPGPSAPTDTNVSPIKAPQVPPGMSISFSFVPAPSSTLTFSSGSPASSSTPGTMSSASP